MNKKREYPLDFYEALKIVMGGGAVKSNSWVDGLFLKTNSYGYLVLVDAGRLYVEENIAVTKTMSNQMFRELKIMTMRELCK